MTAQRLADPVYTKCIAMLCAACLLALPLYTNPTLAQASNVTVPPEAMPYKGAAEYYSTQGGRRALIAVNIWGQVTYPGRYFVDPSSDLLSVLSLAGGPSVIGDPSSVLVSRDSKSFDVDLTDPATIFKIQPGDTVTVQRRFAADLPLIFSAVGTMLSLATFIVIQNNQKK